MLEWKRLRRWKGEPVASHTKIWQSTDGRYVIRRRAEVAGVKISPVPFYALVWRDLGGGRQVLAVLGRHWSENAAREHCHRHEAANHRRSVCQKTA